MVIQNNFVPFILMQRTQYVEKSFLFRAVSKALKTVGYAKYPGLVKVNQIFNSRKIRNLYQSDMEAEFKSIAGYIPFVAHNILDIGCGIGGIDALLAAHYKFNIDVFLIDKSEIDGDLHYGYYSKGSYYNSLTCSKKFLTDNGVPSGRIFLQEANESNSILFDAKFDLIISLISWGFHYPVQTYIDAVIDKLATDGLLIIDVRKDSKGIQELETKFEQVEISKEFRKHFRVKAKTPINPMLANDKSVG